MRSGQDGLLVYESLFSSFEVVGAKDLVGDNHCGCHEPDDSAEMTISSLADFALPCVPLDDQRLLVLHDPFDRFPFFHLERLGKGSGADHVVLLLLIRAPSGSPAALRYSPWVGLLLLYGGQCIIA